MFDFLKPPTDNLYKFIALSGLLLLIVSLIAPGYALVNLEWRRLAAVRELNMTRAEIEQSKAMRLEIDSAKSLVDAALKEAEAAGLESDLANREKTPSKKLKALKAAVEKISKANSNLSDAQKHLHEKMDPYAKLAEDINMRTIDNEYQGEVLESVGQMETLSEILGVIGGLIGTMVSIGGFALWYRKVQVFQDRILARGAKGVLGENDSKMVIESSE